MRLFCLLLLLFPAKAWSQNAVRVPFVAQTPVIDGRLDDHLRDVPRRHFRYLWQFDNPPTDSVGVTYALAYNDEYLYLYIEAAVDSISYHKRGYLWGDGYKLLLALPREGQPSPEYYELSYSPTQGTADAWDRQRIAAYNGSQQTPRLSGRSRSQELAHDGKSGFEALVAWDDIQPYHPIFTPRLGFGLYFAKGKWHPDAGRFANGYSVVDCEGIWNEEILERRYVPLTFEAPPAATPRLRAQATLRALTVGDSLPIEVFQTSSRGTDLRVSLRNSAGQTVFSAEKHFRPGRSRWSVPLPTLPVGLYTLRTAGKAQQIGILPQIDGEAYRRALSARAADFPIGTIRTLLYKLEQMERTAEAQPWYETGAAVVRLWEHFEPEYRQLLSGVDPYAGRLGPYRRAFLSHQDSTLQPYTVKLPPDYDPQRSYPLLVFLHGSGRDERGLLDRPRSNGDFIELAPYGRDKYFAYAYDYAQTDIQEAVADVIRHFPVDTTRMVIGGFSMGGYGALRTYYEQPTRYRGVAVFAGHPDLANAWLEGVYPDFTDEAYTHAFAGKPVFVYHGERDPALGVASARELIRTLRASGARVTARIVPDRGHVYPDAETTRAYFRWLEKLLTP